MIDRLSARRYLALFLPFLPAERHRRDQLRPRSGAPGNSARDERPQEEAPLVFHLRSANAIRVAAVNAAAARLGLHAGMALADARARLPALATEPFDAEADAALLAAMAEACDAFTPLVRPEPPDGLMLDITGCAALFGGEAAMLSRIDAFFARAGFTLHAAIAPTPDMARALARFGAARLAITREGRKAADLPVAALEADEAITVALRRAGLRRLGDLAALPGTALTARFGAGIATALRRILGQEDRRITPERAEPPLILDRRLAEPLGTLDAAETVIVRLLDRAAAALERRGTGGRAFALHFFRTDGAIASIRVETGRPTREPTAILRLFRARIEALSDPIDPGFGFDQIRLAVLQEEAFATQQARLDGRETHEAALADLVDRLAARLGRHQVLRLEARDAHLPERMQAARSALANPARSVLAATPGTSIPGIWPAPEPGEPPARPLLLFEPPCAIEAVAEVPDGPPRLFRWRRALHEIHLAEGPERIEPPWWEPGGRPPARDYYRVEDQQGRRFWLFRAGQFGGAAAPRWFLHGVFG